MSMSESFTMHEPVTLRPTSRRRRVRRGRGSTFGGFVIDALLVGGGITAAALLLGGLAVFRFSLLTLILVMNSPSVACAGMAAMGISSVILFGWALRTLSPDAICQKVRVNRS